jgi:chromosome segregation ATPase
MSKAGKQSIIILIVLLVGSLGFTGFTLMEKQVEKQRAEQERFALENDLQTSQSQAKTSLAEVQKLKDQVARGEEEKAQLNKTIAETEKRIEDFLAQVGEITSDRDKWKQRLDSIKKERDELLVKLKEKPQVIYQEKIVYKEKEPEAVPADRAVAVVSGSPSGDVEAPLQDAQEEHWARLLKDKAALEVEMDKLKGELSTHSIEIVELKQANETLRIEMDAIKHEKENMVDGIRQKEVLANNLSLELVKTKNDSQLAADKAAKLEQQNTELRQQIKELSLAKNAEEEAIVHRLTEDEKLSQHAVENVDLKQGNEALRIDLEAIKHEKENKEEEIRQKEAMVDNLSLELAKTKNDSQLAADKAAKLEQRNAELRQQIKALLLSKSAVEKSIIRLTKAKEEVQKKLDQAEVSVQTKINEIWEIKGSLDRSFPAVKSAPSATEVELSPIVVTADGSSKQGKPGDSSPPVVSVAEPQKPADAKPGFEGKIITINEENNFVIIDVGEKRGVRPGDILGVYRGSECIARLEVIQARQDISAADLKDQRAKVKVGDIVR